MRKIRHLKADLIESALQRHIELIHEGKKQFTCETCDASFEKTV